MASKRNQKLAVSPSRFFKLVVQMGEYSMFFTIVFNSGIKEKFEACMHLLIYFPIRIFIRRFSFLNPELASAALKIPQIYCRLENDNLATLSCLICFH